MHKIHKVRYYIFLFFTFIIVLLNPNNIQGQDIDTLFETTKVDIGGALRFNYNLSSWKPNQVTRGGDFGFEVFRINVDAVHKRWELHLDQRFYAEDFGGAFLKYGWFQYNLNKTSHFKIGLIPSYFGAQQFNSHSWFFQLPFYLGFEDDHDMGISYDINHEKYTLDLAFYKNSENLTFSDNGPISDARYNYDFSGSNKEINQITARYNYKIGKNSKKLIGATIQYGGIWNIETQKMGNQFAFGIHGDLTFNKLNVKAQYLNYNNKPENEAGKSRDWIQMTAYGFPYNTASKAQVYSISIAYTFNLKKGFINSIQLYNNYSYMDKAVTEWEDTQMNVLGLLINANPMFIYVDLGMGKHQPWLGPQWTDALTTGDSSNGWESRFNINFGYYY